MLGIEDEFVGYILPRQRLLCAAAQAEISPGPLEAVTNRHIRVERTDAAYFFASRSKTANA